MAKEINLSLHLALSDHGLYPFIGVTQELDGSGSKAVTDQTIGTSAEALDVGDVASPAGLLMVINRDATNFVDLYLDSGATKPFARLYPGEFACWVPGEAGTPYGKADTAACVCTVFAFSVVTMNTYTPHTSGQYSDALNASYSLTAVLSGDTIATAGNSDSATVALSSYIESSGLQIMQLGGITNVCSDDDATYVMAILLDGDPVDISIDGAGADLVATLPSVGSCVIIPKHPDANLWFDFDGSSATVAILQINRV